MQITPNPSSFSAPSTPSLSPRPRRVTTVVRVATTTLSCPERSRKREETELSADRVSSESKFQKLSSAEAISCIKERIKGRTEATKSLLSRAGIQLKEAHEYLIETLPRFLGTPHCTVGHRRALMASIENAKVYKFASCTKTMLKSALNRELSKVFDPESCETIAEAIANSELNPLSSNERRALMFQGLKNAFIYLEDCKSKNTPPDSASLTDLLANTPLENVFRSENTPLPTGNASEAIEKFVKSLIGTVISISSLNTGLDLMLEEFNAHYSKTAEEVVRATEDIVINRELIAELMQEIRNIFDGIPDEAGETFSTPYDFTLGDVKFSIRTFSELIDTYSEMHTITLNAQRIHDTLRRYSNVKMKLSSLHLDELITSNDEDRDQIGRRLARHGIIRAKFDFSLDKAPGFPQKQKDPFQPDQMNKQQLIAMLKKSISLSYKDPSGSKPKGALPTEKACIFGQFTVDPVDYTKKVDEIWASFMETVSTMPISTPDPFDTYEEIIDIFEKKFDGLFAFSKSKKFAFHESIDDIQDEVLQSSNLSEAYIKEALTEAKEVMKKLVEGTPLHNIKIGTNS